MPSQISIREQKKYRNISWLMPSVDIKDAVERLGSRIVSTSGKEMFGFCPDHHLFTNRKPSDPTWEINTETGKTLCFTEGRGSNLVWVACRLLDCVPKEAVKFLTGLSGDFDETEIELKSLKVRNSDIRRKDEQEKLRVRGLDSIEKDIEKRYLSPEAYQFFVHPPEKKYPTNISQQTVDRYKVFERTYGYYTGRVIIPFFMAGKVVGFCAIDIHGKDSWLRQHPGKLESKYKKVLYPLGFQRGTCLFGYDDCQKRTDLLIVVEGAREVMKLWQEGFTNSVAILGSFMSGIQYDMITRLSPKRVALMFDGDDAGVETTTKVSKTLGRLFKADGQIVKCFLPRGRDPKNLCADDFRKMLHL
jgi:DNA primase